MSEEEASNPVMERLDEIAEHYEEFAENPDARMLRFIRPQDTSRLMEGFIRYKNEADPDFDDIFLLLETEFKRPDRYG